MEISDEYMDSSTINKSKLEDTLKIKKWPTPLFILFITLGQNFLHVMEVELPIPFSYLNVAELHLPCFFI